MRRVGLGTLLISVLMLGCSEPDDDGTPPAGGDTARGDSTGGDMAGGDMAGDDMTGDDMAGDDMAGDDMAGDDMAGDDMAGDDMAGDDMAGDDTGGGDASLVGTACTSKSTCGSLSCAIDGTCQALSLTYDGAAREVYTTYCASCHVGPAPCSGGTGAGGEPSCWDVYANLMAVPDHVSCGADSTQAECTLRRITAGQMPPFGTIPPRAVEILVDWVAAGAPEN